MWQKFSDTVAKNCAARWEQQYFTPFNCSSVRFFSSKVFIASSERCRSRVLLVLFIAFEVINTFLSKDIKGFKVTEYLPDVTKERHINGDRHSAACTSQNHCCLYNSEEGANNRTRRFRGRRNNNSKLPRCLNSLYHFYLEL